MRRSSSVALALVLAACGSARPHIGDDVPVAQLGTFTASADPEALLADIAKARELVAPGARAGRLGVDLATTQGWKDVGVDITRGLAFLSDAELVRGGATFIAVAKVTSRAALVEAVARAMPVTLGRIEGRTQEVLLGDDLFGYLGALGDRTALVMTSERALRLPFDQYLARGGADLAHDPTFVHAFAGLPSGPGLLWHIHWNENVSMYARHIFGESADLERRYVAASLRVGADGVGLRLTMEPDAARALATAVKVHTSPPPLAAMVPDIGWLAMRVSVDPSLGLDRLVDAVVGPSIVPRGAVERELAAIGLSWPELAGALDGHIGFAFDPTTLITRATPDWLVVAGIADPQKADALIEKLASDGKVRAMRARGVLLLASRDEILSFALAPNGKTLADTPAGAVLGGPGFFVLSGDLSRQAGLIMMVLGDDPIIEAFMKSGAYQDFQEMPYLGLSCVADEHGIRVSWQDNGLIYGTLTLMAGNALAQLAAPPQRHPLVGIVETYADEVCACGDTVCVQQATERFSRDSAIAARPGAGSEEDANAISAALKRSTDCVMKLSSPP